MFPQLAFASPRQLPRPEKLQGRVVVLDVAFAATISPSVSFEAITLPFITGLGHRLAAWVDHHDHERHAQYSHDERFVLATKAQHGACPGMIHQALVERVGPIDTIVAHLDLDGLYAAAKWISKGVEIYAGADADAVCIDTRVGTPGPIARRIDCALRARFRDADLKRAIVRWLVEGRPKGVAEALIAEAVAEFEERTVGTATLAARYNVSGRIAYVDCGAAKIAYDKTDLLLAGQRLAPVAIVNDAGNITIAAAFGSGWDFVALLELGGGMPTRVSVPESRLRDVRQRIAAAPEPIAHPMPDAGNDE